MKDLNWLANVKELFADVKQVSHTGRQLSLLSNKHVAYKKEWKVKWQSLLGSRR